MSSSLKIGTIGTGRMAENLGKLWANKGHQIFFGSRQAEKAQALARQIGHNSQGGTNHEAIAFGDIIILVLPWSAAEETLKGVGSLADKVLIDITNPVMISDDGIQLVLGFTTSAAEQVAAWAPKAKVVKAFNSISYENLLKPQFGAERATAFFCGDDAEAKAIVAQLSQDIGFDPVDSGPLVNARLLEPLAILWMQLAFGPLGTDIAFNLLKR